MPNGPQAALAIVAVACSAVSIPLNPRQTLREIETGFADLFPGRRPALAKGRNPMSGAWLSRSGIKILEAVRSQDGASGLSSIDAPQSASRRSAW